MIMTIIAYLGHQVSDISTSDRQKSVMRDFLIMVLRYFFRYTLYIFIVIFI